MDNTNSQEAKPFDPADYTPEQLARREKFIEAYKAHVLQVICDMAAEGEITLHKVGEDQSDQKAR